ncbi:MAG TPA: hypothetical protein VD884_04720 [Ohtaekwangia sp.]|nr:hypothetical protein [Ohtaekwangia sp.]
MTKKEKEEKLENFKTWVTFIDDRVNNWKKEIPEDIANQFDWSLKSLPQVERYILSHYTRERVANIENKKDIDAIASYIGETFRLHLPNARWSLEIDDKRNIDYNIPTVVTTPLAGAPISPFSMILRVLNDKSGDVLRRIFEGTMSVYSKMQQTKN